MKATVIPEPPPSSPPPIVWTIAGTDPGGGAGVQADLKTFAGLGVYGCSVITAVVAQNTRGVRAVHCLDAGLVREQLQALAEDFPPAAIKVGMLGSAAIIEAVASELQPWRVPIICDPVLRSSSGAWLLEPTALDRFIQEWAPLCTLMTPNWPEVESVCGYPIHQPEEVAAAAVHWLERVGGSVLIKGGHGPGDWLADCWSNGQDLFWMKSKRVETRHTHGTGCTLSSAIGATLARGLSIEQALRVARAYVNQGLRTPPQVGSGHGPLGHATWPTLAEDYPEYESRSAKV